MNAEQRDLIERVIHSLEVEPQRWSRTKYRVTHESGAVSVWIANGHNFLAITDAEWGGRDLTGGPAVLIGWLVPWRRRLMRAALALPTPDDGLIERVISKANLSPA